MAEWKIRRFWTDATVAPHAEGYAILLDTRPVRTPAKAELVVPTPALAGAIAAEWQAQTETVRPETMPVTRTANAAIDKVRPQAAEVAAMIAAYGGSDLLCYRAEGPDALILRQEMGWDPLLDWAAETFGARLTVATGIMPVTQPSEAVDRLSEVVHALDPFRLAAFHDLVMLSGSLVLGLAVTEGRIDAETAWTLSRIDEDWQIEAWGEDEEATEAAEARRAAFLDAARIFDLAGG